MGPSGLGLSEGLDPGKEVPQRLSLKGCFLLLCPSGFHPGKAWRALIPLLEFKVTLEDGAGQVTSG